MAPKIYVETSVIVSASLGVRLEGKALKSDGYDCAYNFLQFAEMDYEEGKSSFYTTASVDKEAHRVLESALNNMLERKTESFRKKDLEKRKAAAELFFALLNDCLDQMEVWISYLKQENFDSRKKDEKIILLRDEFRKLDIEFRSEYGTDVANFNFNLRDRILRGVAKFARTIQRKDAFKEYKPEPGRVDLEIMAEIATINEGSSEEVYVASEDGHFCANRNRELLERLFKFKCSRCHELLAGGLIKKLRTS